MNLSLIMLLHTVIGTVVVCAGWLALLSRKGSVLHRFSGLAFTGSMLLMGIVVAAGAKFETGSISPLGVLFAVLMLYLVLTACSTMHRPAQKLSPFDYLAPAIALFIVVSGVILGIHSLQNPIAQENLPPTEAYFFFAALALIAMLLDANHIRSGGVCGRHRYIRHIWRMNCALFFATSTLFTGPGAVVFPESLRGHSALVIPQSMVVILALAGIYKILFKGWRPYSTHRRSRLVSQDSTIPPTLRKS